MTWGIQQGSELAQSFGDRGAGIPGQFAGLMLLVLTFSLGVAVWKMWMASSIARKTGHDPDDAAMVTLLTGDVGLVASYLKADIAGRTEGVDPAEVTEREASIEERLEAVIRLRATGVISDAEAKEARDRILEEL